MAYKLPGVEISFIDDFVGDYTQYHIEEVEYLRVANLPPPNKAQAQEAPTKTSGILGLDLLQYFDLVTDRQNSVATLKRIVGAGGTYRTALIPIPRTTP